jgi:hypothetical protein
VSDPDPVVLWKVTRVDRTLVVVGSIRSICTWTCESRLPSNAPLVWGCGTMGGRKKNPGVPWLCTASEMTASWRFSTEGLGPLELQALPRVQERTNRLRQLTTFIDNL